MQTVSELIPQAIALTPEEKLKLVDELLASIRPVSKEIDQAWKDEILARSNAYKEGRLETVSLDEALNSL